MNQDLEDFTDVEKRVNITGNVVSVQINIEKVITKKLCSFI